MDIDWSDPKSKISKYFSVGEALYLHQWDCYHIPSDEEKDNIVRHALNMDLVRELLGVPCRVHCWMRPESLNCPDSPHHGEDYNALCKGAASSQHKKGDATDYDPIGMSCDDARALLESKLEEWGMRMEKAPGTDWVHNDSGPVISTRYFPVKR